MCLCVFYNFFRAFLILAFLRRLERPLLKQDLGRKSFLKSVHKWTTDFLNKNPMKIRIIGSRIPEKIWSLCMQIQVRIFFSGENKLNVNEKEKKLTPIYIWEKNLVSRQLTCTFSNKTAFIKNVITVLKSLLTVTARMSFAFDSPFLKKKTKKTMRFWSRNFLGRWEKL